MKIRKLLAMCFSIAMVLASAETRVTTQTTFADEEFTTTDNTNDEVKAGDFVWITDDVATFWASDKKFKIDIYPNIKYEIYIIGRYDDKNWRVHIPMANEPERVLLMPVEGYNTEVVSHDNFFIGDINRDKMVDVIDLAMLKRILVEDYDFNLDDYSDIEGLMDRSIDRQLADINSDAEIGVTDVIALQQWLLATRESFRD